MKYELEQSDTNNIVQGLWKQMSSTGAMSEVYLAVRAEAKRRTEGIIGKMTVLDGVEDAVKGELEKVGTKAVNAHVEKVVNAFFEAHGGVDAAIKKVAVEGRRRELQRQLDALGDD